LPQILNEPSVFSEGRYVRLLIQVSGSTEVALLEMVKDKGRTLITALTGRGTFELLIYLDESWAISLDAHVIGVWENTQEQECIETLGRMLELNNNSKTYLVVRPAIRGLTSHLDNECFN